MKCLANIFLIASFVSLVLALIVRLFIPDGIIGLGSYSFFTFSFLALFFVIAISLIEMAFKK